MLNWIMAHCYVKETEKLKILVTHAGLTQNDF